MTLIEQDGPEVLHSSPTMPSKSHAPLLLDLHPTTVAPELWSLAAIPLAFLETIERIEINDARVSDDDGEIYFVLDVFLHHFDTRLPANLSSLRRRASSSTKVRRRGGGPTTTTTRSSTLDYRVERRLSDFIRLRRRIHQVAGLTPYIRCPSCEAFSAATRFTLRQPRSAAMHLLPIVFQEMRKKILAAFVSEVMAMAQCKEAQNRKCECHVIVLELVESFVRDVDADWLAASQSRSFSWWNA